MTLPTLPKDGKLSAAAVLLQLVVILFQWGVLSRISEIAGDVKGLNGRIAYLEGQLGIPPQQTAGRPR